ncbi:MAG: PAS domain S-box protein, partial [Polyangiaceae bacterium]
LNATLEARVAERTAALAASEERQRAILDTVVDAVVTIDLLGTIVDVNPATERMFGHSKAEMLDRNVTMLMPSPYREEHDGYLHRFRRTGVRKALLKGREVMGQRRDGTTFPLELAVGQVAHLGLFTGVLHDLTGRKQIEADVLRIGERERESAAADLHDGVCQELLGLSFLATGMLPDLQALSPRLSTRLRRIANAIAQAAEHTRQVARGMNPLIRGGDGLMEALRQLAETVRHTHRVRCLFQCGEPVLLPESTAAFQIYRVAQEAIQNALRHGQATRVTIRLSEDARSVRLEILDNGRGFPRGVAPADGLGLRTMRYRLGLVGGELTVEQRKRGGVEVRCLVPRPPAAS